MANAVARMYLIVFLILILGFVQANPLDQGQIPVDPLNPNGQNQVQNNARPTGLNPNQQQQNYGNYNQNPSVDRLQTLQAYPYGSPSFDRRAQPQQPQQQFPVDQRQQSQFQGNTHQYPNSVNPSQQVPSNGNLPNYPDRTPILPLNSPPVNQQDGQNNPLEPVLPHSLFNSGNEANKQLPNVANPDQHLPESSINSPSLQLPLEYQKQYQHQQDPAFMWPQQPQTHQQHHFYTEADLNNPIPERRDSLSAEAAVQVNWQFTECVHACDRAGRQWIYECFAECAKKQNAVYPAGEERREVDHGF